MNPIYTYRPFIYRERTDIDAYLEESPVWKELYKKFVEVMTTKQKMKLSPLRWFNEVHYQCVRLLLDRYPEEYFLLSYVKPVSHDLGPHTAGLCFSMVYAVLNTLSDPPEHIPGFLGLLKRKYNTADAKYSSFYEPFAPKTGGASPDLFPCPERPDHIKEDAAWWRRATEDFRQSRIQKIVNLWPTLEEKLEVAQIIEEQFKQIENIGCLFPLNPYALEKEKANTHFFKALRHEVITSAFEQASATVPAPTPSPSLADFIAYTEELPAEQNGHALAIKTMLLYLYNGRITKEEMARILNLGRKPSVGTSFTVNGPLNDIHNNDYVKAGIQ